MTVETPAPSPAADPAAPASAASPAVPAAKVPDPVPYDRFSEVNTKLQTANTELEKFRKDEEKRKQDAALAAGQHQTVIDSLKPLAERTPILEAAINAVIEAEIAQIPKERQSLVPDLAPEKKLAWITANRAILMGTKKTDVNHPLKPADGSTESPDNQTFTTAQIKDPVFYQANSVAIKKAMAEGRIKD